MKVIITYNHPDLSEDLGPWITTKTNYIVPVTDGLNRPVGVAKILKCGPYYVVADIQDKWGHLKNWNKQDLIFDFSLGIRYDFKTGNCTVGAIAVHATSKRAVHMTLRYVEKWD